MEEKVVHMVLKVDLECHRCYKKVRKILCKIPQIRDQVYNEKQGTVMIKVVCCAPEKIMNKISYKGDKSVKSIRIKEPEKEKKNEEKKKPDAKKPDPKVVVQPENGNSPPLSVSTDQSYEGRPFYQYRDFWISMAPPSHVGQPINDSYGGGYGQLDGSWGQYLGQFSDNYNQSN